MYKYSTSVKIYRVLRTSTPKYSLYSLRFEAPERINSEQQPVTSATEVSTLFDR